MSVGMSVAIAVAVAHGRRGERGDTAHLAIGCRHGLARPLGGRPVALATTGGRVEHAHASRSTHSPRARRRGGGRGGGRHRPESPRGVELLGESLERFLWCPPTLVELHEADVLPAFENAPREPGQHAGRTDLDERAHTPLVELRHRGDPADRLRHLRDQARPRGNCIDEQVGRRARHHRQPSRLDRQRVDDGREAIGGGGEQRRVERARHGEALRLHPSRLE